MAPVGRHWSATLGLPLEVITLCHLDILSMPVSQAGKHAAGPMAQKLASYEWTFGEFRQPREGTRDTQTHRHAERLLTLLRARTNAILIQSIRTLTRKVAAVSRWLAGFPGENTLRWRQHAQPVI